MVNLDWNNKNEIKNNLETSIRANSELSLLGTFYSPINNICPHNSNYVIEDLLKSQKEYHKGWSNLLINGDNRRAMKVLLPKFKGKIQLIYIDPPFATGGDFDYKIFIGEDKKTVGNVAYDDKWEGEIDNYLNYMYNRLRLLRELLSEEGSIYIHLDYHASHYLKIMMDEIFGKENFRNEIIWFYPAASAKTRNFFIRSYDTILFYTKSENYLFNDDPEIYMEYSDRVKNNLKKDEKGYFYYRGGSHDGKKLSRKVYVKKKGIFPRDVWDDIPYIRANTPEYQGFSTQKPERLLKRIILASSNKGDIVADFFCGSGTALVVAEKLSRKWIGCDLNHYSIHKAKKRILSICKSNDMIDWKKSYKKGHSPFHSLRIKKPNGSIQTKNSNSMNVPIIKFRIQHDVNKKQIKVELTDYKYPDKGQIPTKFINKITTFSDWIDFWSIDFNFDRNVFNNMWVSFRIPKRRELKLKTDLFTYNNCTEDQKFGVKIIDIMGKETIKIFEL